jgi:hypothetical protein
MKINRNFVSKVSLYTVYFSFWLIIADIVNRLFLFKFLYLLYPLNIFLGIYLLRKRIVSIHPCE